jgi:GNAT superfamily N-acetyltransferase
MQVRKAHVSDAGQGVAVLRRSITELCVLDHESHHDRLAGWLENKTPESWGQWATQADFRLFVAEHEGRVLGVAGMDAEGGISLMYVSPDSRFKGISRALLAVCEQQAREDGATACHLTSTETAHRFYTSSGYRDVGTVDWRGKTMPKMRKSFDG